MESIRNLSKSRASTARSAYTPTTPVTGERTKAVLAVNKAQGIKLGRPRTPPADVVERIRAVRAQSGNWSAIAGGLNADGTPTAQGGTKWHPATVLYVHESRR
jgi:hypothetical protein